MKTNHIRKSGFTLAEVMIVVSIVGLLAAVAVPNLAKARELSQTKTCLANLKQLQCAITVWGMENRKGAGDQIISDELYGPDNYLRAEPKCPAGGEYEFFVVGASPEVTCTVDDHFLE